MTPGNIYGCSSFSLVVGLKQPWLLQTTNDITRRGQKMENDANEQSQRARKKKRAVLKREL